MSDQLFNGLKPLAGTDSLAQTGTVKALSPGAEGTGKAESSSGNSLPPDAGNDSRALQAFAQDLAAVSLSIGRELRFIVDLDSAQPIIQVLDSETGEVIRQIPADLVSSYSLADGVQAVHLLDMLA